MKKWWVGLAVFLPVFIVACGGSDNSEEIMQSSVSLRFSDAPVTDAAKVVITVDTISFDKRNGETVTVDTFTSAELGITDADTFMIDLLEVQGNDNRLVLDSVMLPVGEYQNLRLGIRDENINFSFVEEISTGAQKPIKVPSDELKLGAFTVAETSTQAFVIEFGLRQALTYNPGPERYILKPRGVRVVALEDAATITGTVDLNALHASETCAFFTTDPTSISDIAYLYEGSDLDLTANILGDVHVAEDNSAEDAEFDPDVPANVIAPVAATTINAQTGEYLFSYLLPGEYTLAITCLATEDDPVIYNGLTIPNPVTEIVEITLAPEEDAICNFPLADGVCATN